MQTEYVILALTVICGAFGWFVNRDKARQEADIESIRARQEADIASIKLRQEADIAAIRVKQESDIANTLKRYEDGAKESAVKFEALQRETNKALNDISLSMKDIGFLVQSTMKDQASYKNDAEVRIKENHEEIIRIRDWRHDEAQWKMKVENRLLQLETDKRTVDLSVKATGV